MVRIWLETWKYSWNVESYLSDIFRYDNPCARSGINSVNKKKYFNHLQFLEKLEKRWSSEDIRAKKHFAQLNFTREENTSHFTNSQHLTKIIGRKLILLS